MSSSFLSEASWACPWACHSLLMAKRMTLWALGHVYLLYLHFSLLVPLMPLSLLVSSHGSSMLNLQWKAPTGQRDGYMVSVSEEGSVATRSHIAVEKTSTNITIMRLNPGTCYLIAVWSLAGPYNSASRNVTSCTGEYTLG